MRNVLFTLRRMVIVVRVDKIECHLGFKNILCPLDDVDKYKAIPGK